MMRKLGEEIERLEGVVANMKRKLASLSRLTENGTEMGKREDGGEEGEDLKAVLEGNLGSGWGRVL